MTCVFMSCAKCLQCYAMVHQCASWYELSAGSGPKHMNSKGGRSKKQHVGNALSSKAEEATDQHDFLAAVSSSNGGTQQEYFMAQDSQAQLQERQEPYELQKQEGEQRGDPKASKTMHVSSLSSGSVARSTRRSSPWHAFLFIAHSKYACSAAPAFKPIESWSFQTNRIFTLSYWYFYICCS